MIEKEDYVKIFTEHRCPQCGKHALRFYYPNMVSRNFNPVFVPISQEVECDKCGWYLEYEYRLSDIEIKGE